MSRTSQEIVDQTNAIARIIYRQMGYEAPSDFRFYTEIPNRHPQETQRWKSACLIQELMTFTDTEDALTDIED